MSKYLAVALFMMTLVSCARMSQKNPKEMLVNHEDQFNYTDKNGQYSVKISSGLDKTGKIFFTKRVMELPSRQKDKALEQSVVLSSIGSLKKKMMILRPKASQYNVWFDGKKYTSELKINTAKKAIDVKMTSPESQWNGTKQVKFPNSRTLPCFFSQVIECAKVSGFINKASDKQTGTMNLMIIWEGYPYLNETFSDFPNELFSEAQLEFDGKTKQAERRFNLRVGGQSIFYVLNDKDVMTKMFWVSQGITMVSKSSKNAEPEEAGDFE
ncbi:hypothetical protein SHI21_02250 [Bacteriovorax sp. PP10]|uniref:Lipoprotein n=1 Tax=Bacteriovorax antarcticus TaxID=3088717 RepID=A0ABU5VPN3_9BACT|nr:hypothetical protein [Bacteriovorax sp. PP10]MEA9355001.1 hypothetical protein [Bacteriovorax sp. PP10]